MSGLCAMSGPVSKVSEEDIFSKYTSNRDSQTVPTYDEALRSRTEEYVWPDFLGKDTDSSESLKKLSIPGLWLFSDNDGTTIWTALLQRLLIGSSDDLKIERVASAKRAASMISFVIRQSQAATCPVAR